MPMKPPTLPLMYLFKPLAPSTLYTLSLHDALPISCRRLAIESGAEVVYPDADRPGGGDEAVVVTGHRGVLTKPPQEIHRSQVQSVERAHGRGKGLEGARQHRARELEKGDAGEQEARRLTVRGAQAARMQPCPQLVFEQAARDERLLPELRRGPPVLGQELSQGHRRVEIDHRTSRSARSSATSAASGAAAMLCGGPSAPPNGGVTQPRRTASARTPSASAGLRPARGGTNSATTRSRSVISTVSPPAAIRTYSLSLFLSNLRPTDRMAIM